MGLFNKFIDKVFGEDGLIDQFNEKETREEREQFEKAYTDLLQKWRDWVSYMRSEEDTIKLGEEILGLLEGIDKDKANKRIFSEKKEGSRLFKHSVFGYISSNDPIKELGDRITSRVSSIIKKRNKFNQFVEELNAIPLVDISVDTDAIAANCSIGDIEEVKTQKVGKQFNKMAKLPNYVVIDVETTGLNPSKNKIIELSAIRYELGTPVSAFTTYINPCCNIPAKASEINGIKDDDIKNAPTIEQVSKSFLDFVGNSSVVGYNVSFDLLFLYSAGIDLITSRKIYDVLELARKAWKDEDSYKLVDIASGIGVIYPPHESLADCLATAKVFDEAILEITQ